MVIFTGLPSQSTSHSLACARRVPDQLCSHGRPLLQAFFCALTAGSSMAAMAYEYKQGKGLGCDCNIFTAPNAVHGTPPHWSMTAACSKCSAMREDYGTHCPCCWHVLALCGPKALCTFKTKSRHQTMFGSTMASVVSLKSPNSESAHGAHTPHRFDVLCRPPCS